ncbi:ParB N-terminal domain-containing protein [Pseudokineococcus marinus]|uniref:ParB N-terminal domain-containing protein n=1 Tax=Pseudokineococcus marinus TaxID=351215 RepID=A0A849BK57_9ACTN|nr:ParB N-terminal domain-containing protein [Pseudokineococcus marinus]NNH21663.1 ParB N-terminal domain-containing protein [Pseudokineococcus marinus]
MTGPATRVGLVRLDQVDFHPHNIRRDLGDLRSLSDSLLAYGCVQPISVERWGDRLRLRAGHRRVAAARVAGIKTLPAVIHADPLPLRDWLAASVQENVQRAAIDDQERARTVRRLRDLKATWQEVAAIFGVSVATVQRYGAGVEDPAPAAAAAPVTDITHEVTNPGGCTVLRGGDAPAAAPRAPRPRSTVAVRHLVEVLDRWSDAAPSALLDELRALADTGRLPQQSTPAHDAARSPR